MNSGEFNNKEQRHGRIRLIFRVIYTLFRRLPISFYLAIAMIAALVLGVSGFDDLQNPKRLAFTMALFVLFFGAVVYRAFIEALDMARKYRKENDTLMHTVFTRDNFSSSLGERVAERDSQSERSDS